MQLAHIHKAKKGGPVTSIPINSCQSGNRPVNLDGPGCRGGNERVKGNLVPSSLTPLKAVALAAPHPPPHTLPNPLPPRIHLAGTLRREEGEKGRFPPLSLPSAKLSLGTQLSPLTFFYTPDQML